MSQMLELLMYQVGQIFLPLTLLVIVLLFAYSLYALGSFAVMRWQRRRPAAAVPGFALLEWAAKHPHASEDDREVAAHRLLEMLRITTRTTPMLGLVATMIPMGPALKALSGGDLASVSDNLAIAFSAVILALITAAITFWIVSVRRRWLAEELVWLQTNPIAAMRRELREAA
ncbi:biopolymer transporter ExbD [Rhodanobacter sp. FW510-R12]|uniref:MotA/TolQ/ExbB proton channel family protein n=1 Tax=unclassified Rhodanobacter TaxID=2621553 RepID=UPI0007A99B44|nr:MULTISPECIES: MotA/TolQ/ExbB proton channel family protein [unclassified Rhodanobacter]KZC15600.1 biopolymer transporter ExbD [Rhodanobacter sp. FW104-R8]KZC28313.1 biopolymer transporter ExbD [Rhodanobacter sp. FW510-T8]KZC32688.1 biopolymer transporter ExbD [Rhodanobacter sp. FW510-R10]